MPAFLTLLIKEHVSNNPAVLDNKMFVLYDPEDEFFYLYGARDYGPNEYPNYSYTYSDIDALYSFTYFSMNRFDETTDFTIELHNLDIPMEKYDTLDYKWMASKISLKTEIAAYDQIKVSPCVMTSLLELLVCGQKNR